MLRIARGYVFRLTHRHPHPRFGQLADRFRLEIGELRHAPLGDNRHCMLQRKLRLLRRLGIGMIAKYDCVGVRLNDNLTVELSQQLLQLQRSVNRRMCMAACPPRLKTDIPDAPAFRKFHRLGLLCHGFIKPLRPFQYSCWTCHPGARSPRTP